MSINVNDKNLGHATAYAYYKAGGGTMTEAEFTEFMADFGTASQTAVEAAQAALASKNAAQTAATTATNKATEATTAATTATTKAAEAQADADAAALDASQALSAASTATTKATEATTAAATATSAKTDAVAANTAAQSAKTAAQTAQTGAETAAASVQSSAEQIATNAEDISQLKSEMDALYQALDIDLVANSYWIVSGTPGTPIAYNGWSRTDRLPCVPGEIIKISATVRSPYNLFFNTDTDGDVNQAFTVQVGENLITVPSGAYFYALSNTAAGMQNTTVGQMVNVDDIASKVKLNELTTEVTDVFETTSLYKDVDFSSATIGYFVSSDGVYSENGAFCVLKGISLKKGQTIHITLRGTTTVATLAKALGNDQYEPILIGQGGSVVADQEYTATEDMTVAVSYSKTYDHTGYIFTDVPNMSSLNNKSFYCTPNSGFYSALEAIRADNSSGMRTLYVQAGEYDLYQELGGDAYANACIPDESYVPPAAAWKHFSVVCPDRLKIVGLGEVILKMNIPANTWAEGAIPNSVLAPLSFRYGCEVENITVKCTDTRYGIHIEGSGEADYRKVQYVFKNVTVEYTYAGAGYNSAIGCGLNADDNLILDNCVMKIIGASGNGIAGHLNDGSSNVYVNNSFVNAPTTDFDVKWNTKGKDSRFRFSNTVLDKITLSNGNLGQTPFNIIYEMVRTDATMIRPSDTSITMPTIVNCGSDLVIDEWT